MSGKRVVLWLKQMLSEENMWKVLCSDVDGERSEDDEMVGLIMTYVDDVTVAGCEVVVDSMVKKFQATWTSSAPVEPAAPATYP